MRMMVPKIRVSLSRRNASKREKLVTGFVIMTAMVFLWIEGTSGALQPNLTSVESWGETQIKVTWQPFDHVDNDKPHFYELYIDDYLEYFGNDVIYIARRLTPDTMYHFKLRSCIQDTHDCSLFSKTLSGTTDQSQKRSFIKSFIHWTILCLVVTIVASTTALLGVKITRRLWRSFLYRYDYRSETNLQLPKYAASTDTIDEDLISSLCLKNLPNAESSKDCGQNEHLESREQDCREYLSEVEMNYDLSRDNTSKDNFKGKVESSLMGRRKCSQYKTLESTELACNDANMSTVETNYEHLENCKIKDTFKNDVSEEFSCLKEKRKCGKDCPIESSSERALNTDLSTIETNCKLLNTHEIKHQEIGEIEENHLKDKKSKGIAKLSCKSKTGNSENLTIQRAHTSPKLKITNDLNSKRKNKGHRRALSFDSKVENKKQNELFKSQSLKLVKHIAIPHNTWVKHSTDLVIVVDNSNIFIGAQECARLLNPNERKRHIRVKIQQLVKVFQRGRVVSRAFVQGSSPPTTEQVWEVYRRLGYSVDVEDRRGKDEQRVDEGLHLHIYKALFDLSPQTLVIASGDGNKGKSECATSLPGCAEAAIEKGWKVEIHSWQHSTSMEWIKLAKKYPDLLTIHYLDRYLNHITFVDGKYGRKCQPFPADVFKHARENIN